MTRFLCVIDRETGTGVGISFWEIEENMRRADAAMHEMPPPSDEDGRRTGPAEIDEAVLDESY